MHVTPKFWSDVHALLHTTSDAWIGSGQVMLVASERKLEQRMGWMPQSVEKGFAKGTCLCLGKDRSFCEMLVS